MFYPSLHVSIIEPILSTVRTQVFYISLINTKYFFVRVLKFNSRANNMIIKNMSYILDSYFLEQNCEMLNII